jgi:flagellar biosynthesis GTPase FlhF
MAGSFQDAFVKAGIVTQEDLDRKEAEKKERERKEKERKIAKLQVEEMEKEEAHNRAMAKKKEREQKEQKEGEEHWKKIKSFDDMWHDPKSRNFMVHMIHAFSPLNKAHFAWTAEEMPKPVCCICRCKLASKDDLMKKIPELAKISIEHLKEQVAGTLTNEKLTEDLSKVTEGKVLGVVSAESKIAFCPECFRNYSAWLEYAILRGYSHVHRIINKMRQEEKVDEKNSL